MQKFFILGSVLIMGMGGLLTSAIETDASYTESERQHIKRFIGDDYAKLITGHYPVHSAAFHYRELDRTTFLLDKNPRDLAAHNDQAVANLHLGAFDKSEITLIGMLKDDDKRYATLANLAGHTTAEAGAKSKRQLTGALLQAMGDLDENEQIELLAHLERIRQQKGAKGD